MEIVFISHETAFDKELYNIHFAQVSIRSLLTRFQNAITIEQPTDEQEILIHRILFAP